MHVLWCCSQLLMPSRYGFWFHFVLWLGIKGKVVFLIKLFHYAIYVLSIDDLIHSIFVCLNIWFGRNEYVFNNKSIHVISLLAMSFKWMAEFICAVFLIWDRLKLLLIIGKNMFFLILRSMWMVQTCSMFELMSSEVRGLGEVLPNETSAILLAGSTGLTVNFSPKATELYASSMSIDGFHGGFWLGRFGDGFSGYCTYASKFRCRRLVEDVLIKEVMSLKLSQEKSKVVGAVIWHQSCSWEILGSALRYVCVCVNWPP